MERSDVQSAMETVKQLADKFRVKVVTDWGDASDGTWQAGHWFKGEIDRLQRSIDLLATIMGGSENFISNLDHVTVKKADIGSHGGEAKEHQVSLSTKRPASAWTMVHELAHAWDANHGWGLSVKLEKYTGGSTSWILSFLYKVSGRSDSGLLKPGNESGRRGRKPGCNADGYFYANKPSGSDWNFNRREDFAESVAMYVGWMKNNELSEWAEARIKLHLLPNGANDRFFGVDNWADYKQYFYPENGDYTKTLRWQFVDELVKGNIKAV